MSEQRSLINVSQSQVPLVIKDFSNVLLKSVDITGIVVGVIIDVAQELVKQGIRIITLTIDGIRSEIEIITFEGALRRKLMKLEITTRMCDAELEKAKRSNIYNDDFKVEWERKIREIYYRQMAGIE